MAVTGVRRLYGFLLRSEELRTSSVRDLDGARRVLRLGGPPEEIRPLAVSRTGDGAEAQRGLESSYGRAGRPDQHHVRVADQVPAVGPHGKPVLPFGGPHLPGVSSPRRF